MFASTPEGKLFVENYSKTWENVGVKSDVELKFDVKKIENIYLIFVTQPFKMDDERNME